MKTVGIVAEYNPFHAGHRKQFDRIRAEFGRETAIVCAMSGNFVQRGPPAVLDKTLRAKAAVACGADLVVELPTTVSLSSAEGFAAGGVKILSSMCDALCFGAETGEADTLMDTARALLSEDFSPLLRRELDSGKSFPAARAEALAQMGLSGEILRRPNDILAVEYCKAILARNSPMVPFPIRRDGDYHDQAPHRENPSATAVRRLMLEGGAWDSFVPEPARAIFENAPLHSLAAGERAVLARLRTMTDGEFEALPYGSEGLWRKFQTACEQRRTIEDILEATKSKRYTRTRLNRMLLCAFLGLTDRDMKQAAPYVRLLGLSGEGGRLLRERKNSFIVNAGERKRCPYEERERKLSALYGLFALDATEGPVRRGQVVFPSGFPSVQGQKDVL